MHFMVNRMCFWGYKYDMNLLVISVSFLSFSWLLVQFPKREFVFHFCVSGLSLPIFFSSFSASTAEEASIPVLERFLYLALSSHLIISHSSQSHTILITLFLPSLISKWDPSSSSSTSSSPPSIYPPSPPSQPQTGAHNLSTKSLQIGLPTQMDRQQRRVMWMSIVEARGRESWRSWIIFRVWGLRLWVFNSGVGACWKGREGMGKFNGKVLMKFL